MSTYVGVDWADGRWVVAKCGNEVEVTTEPSILNVWHEHGKKAEAIVVDIPIGLVDSKTRACDEEAKKLLSERGSSVFSIPSREVIEATEYSDAQSKNGGSLGSQSWWLFPRIKEVDAFLQEYENAREKTYESHPEVCFEVLAGDLDDSKDTEGGRKERLEVLEEYEDLHSEVENIIEGRKAGSEWHHRISKTRLDDVLDAAVLAFTAEQQELSSHRRGADYRALPKDGAAETDDTLGITPEIVLPSQS